MTDQGVTAESLQERVQRLAERAAERGHPDRPDQVILDFTESRTREDLELQAS